MTRLVGGENIAERAELAIFKEKVFRVTAAAAKATDSMTLDAAYEHCRRIALGHYENFPVGSVLLPKAVRKHVYAVYAFARAADDFADEGTFAPAERLSRIEDWRLQLDTCLVGEAVNPVFQALAATIPGYDLPRQLFHDLLDAFSIDVKRSRHPDFEALLDYSRCSANPIGRLMLLLFGYRDETWHRMSDEICTALQLTNFWQDILIDLEKDRLYLPQGEMARFGYSEDDLRAHRYNDAFVAMMTSLAERTQAMFDRGKPLCRAVPGRLGVELRLVWLGGTSILEALRRQKFDIFSRRPTISTSQKVKLLFNSFAPAAFPAPRRGSR